MSNGDTNNGCSRFINQFDTKSQSNTKMPRDTKENEFCKSSERQMQHMQMAETQSSSVQKGRGREVKCFSLNWNALIELWSEIYRVQETFHQQIEV